MSKQKSRTKPWARAVLRSGLGLGIVLFGTAMMQAEGPDMESLKASLHASETAFAKSVDDGDIEAFASFIADDAVFSGGSQAMVGKEAIVKAWSIFFSPNGPKIWWRPKKVALLADGSLGTSQGPYRVVSPTEDGSSSTVNGTFFSVWRRSGEGWKVILDNGTDPVPEPPTKKWDGDFEGIEWLEGRWVGEGLGGKVEEIWSAPEGGAMLGSFRLVKDGEAVFYELFALRQEEGKLALRLKHFHGDMKGWEEKDDTVVFPFLSKGDGFLKFDGLRYSRDGDDGLRVEVDLHHDGQTQTETLQFKRSSM